MSLDNFIEQFGGMTEPYWFYDNTIELRYDPKEHVYLLVTNDDLEPQNGVTTVCHIIDKSEALIPWGCKMMAQKLLNTAPSMVLPTGDRVVNMAWPDFETFILSGKNAHKEKLEEAATTGSKAHAWIEEFIKRELDSTRGYTSMPQFPEDTRAENCCRAALNWMTRHHVKWICTERKIYSRKYKYAGTMDGKALVSSCDDPTCCPHQFADRLSVVDWKSSNYLYMEYCLQTAAYEQAQEEELGEDIQDRWVIRLGKDDGEFEPWHLHEDTFQQDFDAFILCLNLTRSVRDIKARMKHRADVIKAAQKEKAKADKEAALKLKCKNADKYKGTRKPVCNSGEGCQACRTKYAEVQAQKVQDAAEVKAQKDQDAIVRLTMK